MNFIQVAASILLVLGGFFYFAGTVGLLRFPDVHSRLHALTKADNLGLGLVCLAMALLGGSWRGAAMLLVIWLLGLLAATVSCHLVAQAALEPAAAGDGGSGGESIAPMGRSYGGAEAVTDASAEDADTTRRRTGALPDASIAEQPVLRRSADTSSDASPADPPTLQGDP